MSDIANAYAAGLFDGEGCVEVYMRGHGRTANCMRLAFSVSGIDLRPLDWLQATYGGKLWLEAEPKRSDYRRRRLGRWRITSGAGVEFAQAIRPFLLVKAEQVDLWLEARTLLRPMGHQASGPLSDGEIAARQVLVDRVAELKHRV